MWICPHCRHRISYIDYSGSVTETGSRSLPEERRENLEADDLGDWENTDHNDFILDNYSCSECGEELSISEIIWTDEQTNDSERLEELIRVSQQQVSTRNVRTSADSEIIRPPIGICNQNNSRQPGLIRCPNKRCKKPIGIMDTTEDFISCPYCNKEIDLQEALRKMRNE